MTTQKNLQRPPTFVSSIVKSIKDEYEISYRRSYYSKPHKASFKFYILDSHFAFYIKQCETLLKRTKIIQPTKDKNEFFY